MKYLSGNFEMAKLPIKLRSNSPMALVLRKLMRNRVSMICICVVFLLVGIAIFGSFISPYDYAAQDLDNALQSPNLHHWFGTDNFGRDVLSRVFFGARYTI